MFKIVIFILISFCFISTALAQFGAKVGDKAPVISVDEWLKGDAVNSFEGGKVYLVEFWGTWCTPCIENIPRLSKLEKKFSSAGLVVIGVATHEFNGREGLQKFMDKRGSEMEYRVAYDSDYSMESDWDTGVKGSTNFRLPVCFLVDKTGSVLFAGHPADESLDGLIEKALGE
jgi:thiol-disulfide isomerase/thioredoxin